MPCREVENIGVVNADLKSVSACGVEESVPHHRPQGAGRDKRFGDKTVYGAKNVRSVESSTGDDFQRRIQGEMANEDGKPAKRYTLQLSQKPKAPIQRGLQCFLTLRRSSRP